MCSRSGIRCKSICKGDEQKSCTTFALSDGKVRMTTIVRFLGYIVVWSALISAAPAQDIRVPSSPGEIKLSFAPAVKRVTPAVVNVYAARIIENRIPHESENKPISLGIGPRWASMAERELSVWNRV